eukprot:437296-Ditylum_brightwellii.AAC.1
MQRALLKSYKVFLQTFIARVNKINDWLEKFPPRDGKTPQIKLVDDKLMDFMRNEMPNCWSPQSNRPRRAEPLLWQQPLATSRFQERKGTKRPICPA